VASAGALSGPDALTVTAESFARTVPLDSDELTHTIQQLYADSYTAGLKDADDSSVPIPDSISSVVRASDWDTWTPGHPAAADQLAGTGFDDLLRQAHVRVKDIDETTRQHIALALEHGVRNGDNSKTIADAIDQVRHNPARSMTIARTEVNRAMTQASIASYKASGLSEFDLLPSPGACPICLALAESNPHSLNDIASQPPVHPNCRCAASPHL
jgi:SPP1 gp7 family putative phage head morphogenesis protein